LSLYAYKLLLFLKSSKPLSTFVEQLGCHFTLKV